MLVLSPKDMADLKEALVKPEFDWSAISVGDFNLDHSQNFFANKENNSKLINENRQLTFSTCATPKIAMKAINEEPPENLPEADRQGSRGNLRMQWSPLPHQEDAAGAATADAPKAYAFKDVYECNRQQALRRQEEEERQARIFRSRPMPNFKAMHKRIEDRVVIHRITCPQTPETVKYWKASVERRQAKEQEEHDQKPVPSRHPTFNLRSEQRVRDRRDFDTAVQVRQAQKKKEQDEERKQREEVEMKEMRKMTAFKARPNPFK